MTQTIEKTWNLLEYTVTKLSEKKSEIYLNKAAETLYDEKFRFLYKEIKNEYMKEKVENLDRHKVASIVIVSILNSNAVLYKGQLNNDQKFIGNYAIAASVGITYLQDRLNDLLVNRGIKPVEKIIFPEPLSCDTPYFEVFIRNLYYSDRNPNWGLNPLDIADKLFLFENQTLEKNGINPLLLKDIK